MISFVLLFLLLLHIPSVHCVFCCAAVLNRSQDISEWKTETINTSRMYLRVRMLVSSNPIKMTLFSLLLCQAPCVMLEWKPRVSCFLWTSLGSGIVLPCGCSAECLYIVTLLASLILTYFQFDPLFSIRTVIDLHLSLNLHEDEDRER